MPPLKAQCASCGKLKQQRYMNPVEDHFVCANCARGANDPQKKVIRREYKASHMRQARERVKSMTEASTPKAPKKPFMSKEEREKKRFVKQTLK